MFFFLIYFTVYNSFIHLIRTDSNTFSLIAEEYSIVYMYHSLLIQSSANGHLGCFPVLAVVNSATMSIGVHMSLSILVSLVCMYAQQWDCWVIWQFYFQFLKESPHFSIVAVQVCIPTNSVRGFPFLHTLSSIYCL